MARYLTPSKISFLALAVLYSEGAVPTSHSISILKFLLEHILPDGKRSGASSIVQQDPVVSMSTFENALDSTESMMPGRTVYDILLKKLWTIDCSDALDVFINHAPCLLARSRDQILKERETGDLAEEGQFGNVQRTSPLGAFIRRCYVEYTRLQFQDAMAIWQDFIAWRAPGRATFERKNPRDGRGTLDVNLSELQIDSSHPIAGIMYGNLLNDEDKSGHNFSTFDAEKLMEFQVSEMQRLGGRLPEDMRSTLGQISKAGIFVPKLAHYLKFLDSWRAGDYTSAFDNLHRYFDYTMLSRDRIFYQYALLNLAILQADFGCYSEAIPAMQEAIATARENKDTTCLNFCLSWLYHFGRTFPSEMKVIRESGILGTETEGLAFLKSRARDAEMWSLLSTSLLSEAKLGLQRGDSVAGVFENIAKASHINVSKAITNVAGPTLLMRASAFSRVGVSHLAWTCSEAFLQCYVKDAPLEDVLKCTCRMAGILAQGGRHNEAMDLMDGVPDKILRVLKYHNYWMFYTGLLKLRHFVHRGDLLAADRIANQLKGQGPPDLEIGSALAFLRIELLVRRSDLAAAIKEVETLADRAESENSDVVIYARLMVFKARILALSGHPLKGFTIVTRAAQIAYRARVLPTLWDAVTTLCNILNVLKEFQPSIDLLHSITPRVLECQDCDLAARTYSCLAGANMGLAGKEDAKSTRRKELVNRAMGHVESAFEQYKFVEDLPGQLDMLYKKANIMKWRGDLTLANDVGSQYLQLKREYETTQL